MPGRYSDIIVVGGGASGLMAAIAAAEHGGQVILVEKNIRVGKRILATGNGRCNLSNAIIGKPEGNSRYNRPDFVAPVLERFDCTSIRVLFYDLGLLTITDKNGWVFPRTQTANTVLDVLLRELDRLAIVTYAGQEIIGMRINEDGYRVETTGSSFAAKNLILCCGVEPLLKAFPFLNIIKPEPILGPLRTDTDAIRGLDGVRASCRISLREEDKLVCREDGELLFRDYGVSGIAVFNLSRFAKPGQKLLIDFFPDLSHQALKGLLLSRIERNPDLTAPEALTGILHSRIIQAVLRKTRIKTSNKPDDNMLNALVNTMKRFSLTVTGGPTKDQAQLTRGGLNTEDFNPNTLESKTQKGLFAAGECLDIDGPCGGFNLHWAWASGLTAGESAALSLR